MRILFLGRGKGTGEHRVNALRRQRHDVTLVDPEAFVPQKGIPLRVNWETGGVLSEGSVTKGVLREVGAQRFDVVWVDGGRYVGPSLLRRLRDLGPVLNYNNDDPYGWRDRLSYTLMRRAIPFYDLVTVVREVNVAEARALGARSVMRIYRTADEVAHAPCTLTDEERTKWKSDVLFVGTFMEDRGAFMKRLLDLGVPLTIYGDRWDRAPEWRSIRHVCHPSVVGESYAKTIQAGEVCLGLLSKGNRDLHTRRSIEVPYGGSLLCAERTEEHLQLYNEWSEAVFWDDADECAEACRRLMDDEDLRSRIRTSGRERCLANGYLNEKVTASVLDAALARSASD